MFPEGEFCCCLVQTHTATVHVTEKCGSKHRILQPGLSCLNPCVCEKVVSKGELRDTKKQIRCEVRSLDDAIAYVTVELVTRILDYQEMYYTLQDPPAQMRAFVEDSLRSQCAAVSINAIFLDKQVIADEVRRDIQEDLQPYGIKVVALLLTQIDVSRELHKAMTKKEVAKRNVCAARDEAEAEKIRVVKNAEGQADAEALHGSGIARQRQELLDGVRLSINDFHRANPDVSPQECYDTVLLLQYLEALQKAGGDDETLMLPYGGTSVDWCWEDLERKRAISCIKYKLSEADLHMTPPDLSSPADQGKDATANASSQGEPVTAAEDHESVPETHLDAEPKESDQLLQVTREGIEVSDAVDLQP